MQEIQKLTNSTITITEEGNKGLVDIFCNDKEGMELAIKKIKAIVAVPEIGAIYQGTVKSIMDFGAFVEILPNKDGLLHISEIDYRRFDNMLETGIKEGDTLEVKLLEVDEKTGKMRLSRRALLEKPENWKEPEHTERQRSSSHGNNNRRHDNNRRGGGGGNRRRN